MTTKYLLLKRGLTHDYLEFGSVHEKKDLKSLTKYIEKHPSKKYVIAKVTNYDATWLGRSFIPSVTYS